MPKTKSAKSKTAAKKSKPATKERAKSQDLGDDDLAQVSGGSLNFTKTAPQKGTTAPNMNKGTPGGFNPFSQGSRG